MQQDYIVTVTRQYEGKVVVAAHSAEEATSLVEALDIHRLVDVLKPSQYGNNAKAEPLVRFDAIDLSIR